MKLFATPSVELNSENNPFLRLRNRPSTRFLYTGDMNNYIANIFVIYIR